MRTWVFISDHDVVSGEMIVWGAGDPTALCRLGNGTGSLFRTERVSVCINSGLNLLGAVDVCSDDIEFLSSTSEVE